MRIAFFTDTYLPQANGVAYAIYAYAKFLGKKHAVKIFTTRGPGLDKEALESGVSVERYRSIPLPGFPELRMALLNPLKIGQTVKTFDPDIIHIQTPGPLGMAGIAAAKILKKPLVGTYHADFSQLLSYLLPSGQVSNSIFHKLLAGKVPKDLTRHALNAIYSSCDVITCPSRIIRDEVIGSGIKNKTIVLSNGIDLRRFPMKKSFVATNNLFFVGRLGHEKHVDVAVKTLRYIVDKISSATLTIIGTGPLLSDLRSLARKLKVDRKVFFLGRFPNEELSSYYQKSDLFLFPATAEVQPLVVLEAMASGLPVIGVNQYGVPDLVHHGINGFLVETPDEREMANYALTILKNKKLRMKLARNARKTAEENSIEKAVKKLERVYKKLVDRTK